MEARSLFVVVVLIILAVLKYVARDAKNWKTPSGTTLAEQLKKRDERMAAAQDAPYRPASPRQDAPQRSVPPRRSMPPPDMPDAACVVCDNTGEDHFAHDKAQRIAQLDDFLKNGIIDKAEYRTLRERYERGL